MFEAVTVVLAAYLLVVSAGPASTARFRVPVVPVMAMFGGMGLACWLRRRRPGPGSG